MASNNLIGGRFSRSWEITKKTFQIMRLDKEMLLFPILSSVFSIILFLIFIFPIFLSYFRNTDYATGYIYIGIFAFYFATTFVAVFFNVGIIHIARTRFEGGDATFMDGIKMGFKRFKQIIGWALLSATVGLILNILESSARERRGIGGLLGRIVVSLIGMAWAIVSLFVVPAIVIKGYGPIEALKSSVQTIKKTWGESLIKYLGLGVIKSVFVIVGLILFLVPGLLFLFSASLTAGLIFIGIFIFYLALVVVIFSAASSIFDTALFLYADTGKVPKFYAKEELSQAFVRK